MSTQRTDVRYQRERHTHYYISTLLKSLDKGQAEQDKTIYVVQKKFMVTLMYHA